MISPARVSATTIRARAALTLPWAAIPLVALASLLGIAAVVSPEVALAGAAASAFIVVAFLSLTAGLALFVVLTFFELAIGGANITAVKLVGAVLAASWLVRVVRERRTTPLLLTSHPFIAFAALLFVALAAASMLWAVDIDAARASALSLAQGVLLLFIAFSTIRDERDFRLILWAFVGGALVTAGLGVLEPSGRVVHGDVERLSGGVGDPNELAAILVPALAFAASSLAAVRGAASRLLLLVAVVASTAALFLTHSRGGLVGLATAFVATVLLAGRLRRRALASMAIIAAFAVSYYIFIAPPQALERVTDLRSDRGSGRQDLWPVAVDAFRDHPIVGVGIGNFRTVKQTYAAKTTGIQTGPQTFDTETVVHNTYLDLLAEVGIVGFAAFAAVVVGAVAIAIRAIRALGRTSARGTEALARGFLVGLIGMLAAFTFLSAQYEKQLWLLLGLALAVKTLATREAVPAPHSASHIRPTVLPRVQMRRHVKKRARTEAMR